MGRFALIPATPILLAGVDRLETPRIAMLRAAVEDVLRSRRHWSLPVEALPPVAGLGGFGIDRGIDTHTGRLLSGDDWIDAVGALDAEERSACESAHPAIGITLLHAHSAGVSVGPLDGGGDLIVPLDLSAAAGDDSPLAPVPGASVFDAAVVDALRDGDEAALVTLVAGAAEARADLELLSSALDHGRDRLGDRAGAEPTLTVEEMIFDTDIHDVRSICAVGSC